MKKFKKKVKLQLTGATYVTLDVTVHPPETMGDGHGRVVARVSEISGPQALRFVNVIGSKGIAVHNPPDVFDWKFGKKLAQARALETALHRAYSNVYQEARRLQASSDRVEEEILRLETSTVQPE